MRAITANVIQDSNKQSLVAVEPAVVKGWLVTQHSQTRRLSGIRSVMVACSICWCNTEGQRGAYVSPVSARSSARSKSASTMASLRATCVQNQRQFTANIHREFLLHSNWWVYELGPTGKFFFFFWKLIHWLKYQFNGADGGAKLLVAVEKLLIPDSIQGSCLRMYQIIL